VALGEPAIALEAARQVRSHGLASFRGLTFANSLVDAAMLPLDVHQILSLRLRCADRYAHALARNDMTSEKFEKLRDYLYRMDDMVNCSRCKRRFEIPSHQNMVFL